MLEGLILNIFGGLNLGTSRILVALDDNFALLEETSIAQSAHTRR